MSDITPVKTPVPFEDCVSQWTPVEVIAWFQGYVDPEVIAKHKIDGPALLELTREDLIDDLGCTPGETLDVIIANIENLKVWERKNAYLDEEIVAKAPELKDHKWTSFGKLHNGGLLVMGSNDHDGEPDVYGNEDCAQSYLTLITPDGNDKFKNQTLEISYDLGRDHSLVVDPEMRWIYTSENHANCIKKWSFDGRLIQTLPDTHGPMAIDPATHNLWILLQTGCIATQCLRVYSTVNNRWKLLKELPYRGQDICYDSVGQCMWVVGPELMKFSTLTYTQTYTTPFTTWHPIMIEVDDFEKDNRGYVGCVWVIEGATTTRGSKRLCQYSLGGDLMHEWTGEDGKDATRVSKDTERYGVWVLFSKVEEDEIMFMERDLSNPKVYTSKDYFEGKTLDVIHLDGDGYLWVIGYTERRGQDVKLYKFNPETEKVCYSRDLPKHTSIAWMTSLIAVDEFDASQRGLNSVAAANQKPGTPYRSNSSRNMTATPIVARTRPTSAVAQTMSPGQLVMAQSIPTLRPDPIHERTLMRLANNIGDVPLTDDRLREIFNSLDDDRSGVLSKRELKRFYASQNSFGLDDSKQFEGIIDNCNMLGDGMVSYEEFAVIMLKLAAR